MKAIKYNCDLNTCMLCQRCLPEWKPAVGQHRQNLLYRKGESIFEEGKTVNGIYLVYSGMVKVHKYWNEEKDLILRFAGRGDILGHRGLGKDNLYPVSATALEEVVLCYFPMEFFISTLKVNHEFLFDLMMFYAAELKESERNMRNLAHMPVKGRIAQALCTLQEKFGEAPDGSIKIQISKQDLAAFVGTTYETFFRMINELIAENLISVAGRRIYLTNDKKLEELTLLPR